MRKALAVVPCVLFVAMPCLAQGPCYARPGSTHARVLLAPNSMEPACEPQRLRVNDRDQVVVEIFKLSPTELCVPAASAPTLNAVTSPVESIINTISGLKSFNLVQSDEYKLQVDSIPNLIGPKTPPPEGKPPEKPDPTAVLFHELAEKVLPAAQAIAKKQQHWQQTYLTDLTQLNDYGNANYRGSLWSSFDPEHEQKLDGIRQRIKFPPITSDGSDPDSPPSEMDYVALQALVDQLKDLQPRLINACTATSGTNNKCDQEILASTSKVIEQANSYLLVAADNLKTLQTAQAAEVTAYNGLVTQRHQFDLRYNKTVQPRTLHLADDPDDGKTVLVQLLPLGTNYGVTAPGTLTCSTTATPAVATTDAINIAVQYQNIPALTISAGLLISTIEQKQYGVSQQLPSGSTTIQTAFIVTNSARASVVPMAYVNYRIAPPIIKTWWGEPNQELDISHNVSAGIGINANTGTNQPEFFGGYAIGFSRSLIHIGLDYGRSENLGQGFSLGVVPTGFTGTTAPIVWKYHPTISIGFSVRIAPF